MTTKIGTQGAIPLSTQILNSKQGVFDTSLDNLDILWGEEMFLTSIHNQSEVCHKNRKPKIPAK